MNNHRQSSAVCDFCGLPVLTPRFLFRPAPPGDSPAYCCSGCRLAASILAAESQDGHAHRIMLRLGIATFCTMNVLAFSMALWSRDVYGKHFSDDTILAGAIDGLFRYATLFFAVPVLLLLGGPLLANAWQALRRGVLTADVLILFGVVGAYIYSTVSVVRGDGSIYFEVGCVVLAFLTLGRWFEANSKMKMSQALDDLAKLLPNSVHQVLGDTIRDVPREAVQVGDTFRVLAGERFAVDGRIVVGEAEIDEQTVTGESRTVTKAAGDLVYSGTLNLDGDLRIIVTAAAGQETVSRLLELVRKARRTPGNFQRLADQIAVWFVPLTCIVALATATYRGYVEGLDAGILSGLAVLLIACPCAFALATPMAVWTAMGRAARGHVLFRNGLALERLARVDTMFFDKTGTLTDSVAEVSSLVVDNAADRREVLQVAVSLASASNHSFSLAIRRYAGDAVEVTPVDVVTTVPGKGLCARFRDDSQLQTVCLGSHRLMDERQFAIADFLERSVAAVRAHASFAFIGWAGQVKGVFVLVEQIRPETPRALDECRRLSVRPIVLTGDTSARAARLETELETIVLFERLPEEKVAAIELARRGGSLVGMVGDGINDAPALAAADIGIAMGCGADLSRDSAAVCLLSNDLSRLPWTISLARKTVRIIRQNLFWAFIYNIVGIGLAITGNLNPIWAGVAMVASSFLVITNSLRLNSFPDNPPEAVAPISTSPMIELETPKPSSHFDSMFAQTKASVTELHPIS